MSASAKKCAGIAAALMLSACTTVATPYQPYVAEGTRGIHGGYSEQQLSADRFRVQFHGNAYTTRDRVEGYLLYRAAELTLRQGGDWFVLVDRQTDHQIERTRSIDPNYHPWFGSGYLGWHPEWRYYAPGAGWAYWHAWSGDPFWGDRVNWTTIESFEASAVIDVRRGPMPVEGYQAYDARKVLRDLGPSIELPPPAR